jgi:hypothetical protein
VLFTRKALSAYTVAMKTLLALLTVLMIALPVIAGDDDIVICAKDVEIGECPIPPPDTPVQTREPTPVMIVTTPQAQPQIRMPTFTGISGLRSR